MNTPMITLHYTVEEVLQQWPATFSVFMKNKTKCPGCFLQHFCTLKDVAETYGISFEKLLEEITGVIDPEQSQRSSL
jgi:hybrid cluster-associated redox disulfide protein